MSSRLAAERQLPVIDATCPLVAKVHNEGRRYAAQGREIVLIGHAGHAEVEGTIGQVPAKVRTWFRPSRTSRRYRCSDPDKLAYVTQTTLSVDDTRGIIAALKARFPDHHGAGRARHLLRDAEPPARGARPRAARWTSSWLSARATAPTPTACARSAKKLGKPSYLIDDADALRAEWFEGVSSVGVTAGASAPEMLVQGVLDGLRRFGEIDISTLAGVAEDVRFRFPKELAET